MSLTTMGRVVLLLLSLPRPALAHSPFEGAGVFYGGLLHPLGVPAHLLLIIALGLYAGQSGIEKSKASVLAFVLALISGLVGASFFVQPGLEPTLLAAGAIVGLFVASKLTAIRYLSVTTAAVAGFLVAYDSPQESLVGIAKLVAMIGTGLGIFIAFCIATLISEYFNSLTWQKIAVRVMGSWIAAASLLVLALSLSYPA
ncbi:HupE/UreJ family protein [Agarivorans albus]|uniref:HupE/UreJ family protein n=1 Tax=Agarivorans albus TaxID=182262 RepID=UPI001FE58A52|nr:HupE/UreJ family protein [Agarivorans albus]